MGGKELLYVSRLVVVTDKDRNHDTAEDEHHIHIGIVSDGSDYIKRFGGGNDLPHVGIQRFHRVAVLIGHHRHGRNHCRDDGGNSEENVKERCMEQTVKVNPQHTLDSLCKGRILKF